MTDWNSMSCWRWCIILALSGCVLCLVWGGTSYCIHNVSSDFNLRTYIWLSSLPCISHIASFRQNNLIAWKGRPDVFIWRRNSVKLIIIIIIIIILRHMDGQHPSETQSIKNWANMVGFIMTAEALPNERSKYRRCFDQAFQLCSRSRCVHRRWSISGGSNLSSLPHVLLSPSLATCRAPESHHGLRSFAHQSTGSQTIATESWLACHRPRSTGYNPFSMQQFALCCSYQAGPVSRIWCVCSSTGF